MFKKCLNIFMMINVLVFGGAISIVNAKLAGHSEGESSNEVLIPLIQFQDEVFSKGWNPNAWGGGTARSKVVNYPEGKFKFVLQTTFKNTRMTLSNPKLFDSVKDIILKTPANGMYLWYRMKKEGAGDNLLVLRTRDSQGKYLVILTQGYLRANDEEWHFLKFPFFANRNSEAGVLLIVVLNGTGVFDIGEIGLLCSGR